MNAIDQAAQLINECLGRTQDRDHATAQAIAYAAVQIEHLGVQREMRDTMKLIDHRLQQFTIESKRDPIGYRIAGLLIAKQLVQDADDRLAALGDIEQTIAEMRAQMDGGA